MTGRALFQAADMHDERPQAPSQDEIGGARDSCGWCRRCNDGASTTNDRRFGLSAKTINKKAVLDGTSAGALLHAARQASQPLRCSAGAGWWSPEPSAMQMIANGSTPKWPAGTKPQSIACSAIP